MAWYDTVVDTVTGIFDSGSPSGPSFDDASTGKFTGGTQTGSGGGGSSIFDMFGGLFDDAVGGITGAFTDSKGDVDYSKVIGAGGALGSYLGLFDTPQQKVGYQGGIPDYTATRLQVPNTYDPERRPGSGGQRYFTDVSFSGADLQSEADRLEALNKANIASRTRAGVQMPDVYAARQAAAAQQTAAPTATPAKGFAQGGIAQFAGGRKINVPENTAIQQAAFKSSKPIEKRKMKNGKIGLYQGNVFLGYADEGISGSDITGAIGDQVDRLKEFGSGVLDKIGMQEGGIAQLKKPQYLDGATDGMADKIDASIEGEQPAALSDGEFVIPADVVSHLGNGNSEAGAKVLEKMMARVRKERTGSTKQGKEIVPQEFLPA